MKTKIFIVVLIYLLLIIGCLSLTDIKSNIVYISNNEKIYHYQNCRYLGKNNTYVSLTEACRMGCTACPYCNPPSCSSLINTESNLVYISKDETIYHYQHCLYLSKDNTYVSLTEACRMGYTDCPVCRPPKCKE